MSCLAKCCSHAANVERQTGSSLPVRGGGGSEDCHLFSMSVTLRVLIMVVWLTSDWPSKKNAGILESRCLRESQRQLSSFHLYFSGLNLSGNDRKESCCHSVTITISGETNWQSQSSWAARCPRCSTTTCWTHVPFLPPVGRSIVSMEFDFTFLLPFHPCFSFQLLLQFRIVDKPCGGFAAWIPACCRLAGDNLLLIQEQLIIWLR